jgi:hypothetical protein
MTAVDERIVTLALEINGQLKTYSSPMFISSTGKKTTNPLESEIEVKIANLTKEDTDYLLTNCSPFNKNNTPKLLVLSAGRVSTGVNEIFRGNITKLVPSQPPDIMLSFKCKANQFLKGKIVASQQPPSVPMSTIANQVASDCGLSCDFQATDKNVANYAFAGGALKQVNKLAEMGGVNAWVDGDKLMVTDQNVPLKGVLRVLDAQSGMVGIPEITEQESRSNTYWTIRPKSAACCKFKAPSGPASTGIIAFMAWAGKSPAANCRFTGSRKPSALTRPARS